MNNNPGIFIDFEGIDGSGKGTLIAATVKYLEKAGHLVCEYKEPGGLDPNDVLRTTLRDLMFTNPTTHKMPPNVIDCLMLADHITNVEHYVKPALAIGRTVVEDRYAYSQFAYAVARVVHPGIAQAYEDLLGPVPDKIFLLMGTPEHLLSRAQGRTTEVHQNGKAWNAVAAQRDIQEQYLRILSTNPATVFVYTDVLTPDEIFSQYIQPVLDKLKRPELDLKLVA